MFRAKLSVEVWLDKDPQRQSSVVEIHLDKIFTLQQISEAGTALQAGSWEALKIAVKTLISSMEKQKNGETPDNP